MFGGSASNPYDDIVAKTTDENLTSENWELILNLCDKVSDEKDEGAHNVIAALLKRLAHRNPNVQLYALSLADALSKNCGMLVNKELASRAFTQGLEKIVMDRTTHDKVRKRTLALVAQWSGEFENDTSLGVMEDCYNNLKSKGYKFDTQQEPLPPAVDDEIRRKEEEELQRVLEMSMQDRGGRDQWAQYSLSATSGAGGSSSAVGGSSSSSKPSGSGAAAGSSSAGAASGGYAGAPKYQGGYVPARTPSPQSQQQPPPRQEQQQPRQEQQHRRQQPHIQTQTQDYAQAHSAAYAQAHSNLSASSVSSPSAATTTTSNPIVTRVRALHTFEPTEPGELAFEKGDIIKVVDRGYKDWWRGQLKGRTGIFPVNYVEPMPEPTATELAREAEQEAAVFSQAVNVEKLLNMLRAFDPAKDNLADNEEIQELYRSSMALRPKIVKLIDKYSQKRADLVSMNETFVRARTIFDRMMEESLARHTGLYDTPQGPYRPAYGASSGPGRPDSQARVQPSGRDYVTSPAGGAPGYPGYPVGIPQAFPEPQPTPTPTVTSMGYPAATPPAAAPGVYGYPAGPQPQPQPQPHSQIQPLQPQPSVNVHQQPQSQPQTQPSYSQMANAPYSAQGPTPYPTGGAGAPAPQPQIQPQPQQSQPQPQPQQPIVGQQQQQQQQQQQPAQGQYGQNPYQAGSQPGYDYDAAASGQAQYQAQPQAQPQQPQQAQPVQHTPQVQPQPQTQPQTQQPVQQQQAQPVQQPVQQQQQAQQQAHSTPHPVQQQQQPQPTEQQQQQQPSQAATQHQPSTQSGPPYIFDPNATYADPNVQAWAQYYAQGGRDLAGSVYFVSIPGLTDGSSSSTDTTTPTGGTGGQAQPHAQSTPGGGYQHPQQDRSSLDQGTYATQQQPQLQQQTSNPYFDSSALGAPQQQQQLNNGSSTSLGSNPHSAGGPATLGATSPGTGATGGYGTSPSTTASTPSWVLPKKGAGQGGGDVQGLSGRFGGVSLTDPGTIG